MAGIMAYRHPEDSCYVTMCMERDEAFHATKDMMTAGGNIFGITPVACEENITVKRMRDLEKELNKVFAIVNSQPIPLKKRELMIKEVFG
jgi:hypothetical protein